MGREDWFGQKAYLYKQKMIDRFQYFLQWERERETEREELWSQGEVKFRVIFRNWRLAFCTRKKRARPTVVYEYYYNLNQTVLFYIFWFNFIYLFWYQDSGVQLGWGQKQKMVQPDKTQTWLRPIWNLGRLEHGFGMPKYVSINSSTSLTLWERLPTPLVRSAGSHWKVLFALGGSAPPCKCELLLPLKRELCLLTCLVSYHLTWVTKKKSLTSLKITFSYEYIQYNIKLRWLSIHRSSGCEKSW